MTKDLSKAYKDDGKKFFDVWDDDIQWIEHKISYYNKLINDNENEKANDYY